MADPGDWGDGRAANLGHSGPMTHIFQVTLTADFPLEDVGTIGRRLAATGGLQPGFIPPGAGALDPVALFYAAHQGWTLVVLPDRNLVSRMARIAREGAIAVTDGPTRFACDLMAFCQAMNLLLEPAIAYHELAHCLGNDAAHEELAWFRAADRGAARAWIDLAMGRRAQVDLGAPEVRTGDDLAYPLKRWRRNYIVALKVAALELEDGPPLDKALELLRWMYEDFQIAGPAAIFALFFLAPRNARRGLMKRLRARDRTAAIQGVRNAAWDMTYLSDFVLRINEGDAAGRRYFFATADADLAAIAPVTLSGLEAGHGQRLLVDFLDGYWPPDEARHLADLLRRYVDADRLRGRPPLSADLSWVARRIEQGEERVRAWSGS